MPSLVTQLYDYLSVSQKKIARETNPSLFADLSEKDKKEWSRLNGKPFVYKSKHRQSQLNFLGAPSNSNEPNVIKNVSSESSDYDDEDER